MTPFRVGLKADGSAVGRRLDEQHDALARRIRTATERAGRELLVEPLRQDLRSNLASRKLPTTWRLKVHPDPYRDTLNPAAVAYSRAGKIITAHEKGAVIRPLGGRRYLWLPTEAVPDGPGGKPYTPERMETRLAALQLGGFRFAKGRNGTLVAYVVASGRMTRNGVRLRKKGAKGRTVEPAARIVLYVLVRQVTLRKRLDVAGITARARAAWPARLQQAVAQTPSR